jgi:hypothetical protein
VNELILLFSLTTLPFELKASCVPGILHVRKPKMLSDFQTPLLKKGSTIPPEKWPFLLDIDFLVKETTNLTSNST